jgi:hypothetical protein
LEDQIAQPSNKFKPGRSFQLFNFHRKAGAVFMKNKKKKLSLNFKQVNWKIPILFMIACFYLLLIIVWVTSGSFYSIYGKDYLAYWSAGKIADELGYSEIYNLENIRSLQTQKLEILGALEKTEDLPIKIFPMAYFSFFVLPFQILSRIDLVFGYWSWIILNLIILIGYLVFFLRRMLPENGAKVNGMKLLIPILLSYPVYCNIILGQVEILLVICAGEFIRNSVRKKPFLAGLWLGGLLIKPQLLILIIPISLIMRNWKVLMGFAGSSAIILVTSFILSGFDGMKALINLWTRYSVGIATGKPEAQINWRMIGLNLNSLLNTSLGWVIIGLGMVLTILALYFLIKQNPTPGSPSWVMTMLGVFSATIAITWHAHQHMAMVLIPFLIYALQKKLLPEKIVFAWVVVTPIVWIVMGTSGAVFSDLAVAISGFALNLVILFSTMQFTKNNYLKLNLNSVE